MTINELYLSYESTAKTLYSRRKELLKQAKEEIDPIKKKAIELRANAILSMYKDVRQVAKYLEHYYRKWGYKD